MFTFKQAKKTLLVIAMLVVLVIVWHLIFTPLSKENESLSNFSVENAPDGIDISANRIMFGSSFKIYDGVSQPLKTPPDGGQAFRILHIGDSHVQADFFTGETRRLLSAKLADGNTSRGFTFPYQIAGSNNPDDYEVTWKGEWYRNRADSNSKGNLGIAGISVSTSDADGGLNLRLKSGVGFDRVRIFFDSNSQSVLPLINHSWNYQSIEDGMATYHLESMVDTISIGIDWNGFEGGKFTLYGFELINSGAKFLYHAAGVNGASVKTFLSSNNFYPQLKLISPQIVIVSLGTNDAYNPNYSSQDFSKNLKELVENIKETLPSSVVILTTPGDHLVDRTKPNPHLLDVHKQIIAIANEFDCGVWDFHSVMGGEGSIEKWFEMGLAAPDKLHLNRKGYKLKGALLFDALVKLTEKESKPTLVKTRLAND